MALLKTRPKIELYVPSTIAVGRRLGAEVRLHAPEDVEVEHVQVDLSCRSGWTVGAGKSQVTRRDDLLRLRATPFHGPLLTRGQHAFRVAFDIPEGLPPSHDGGAASTEWAIDVEVSIPWWPDARSHHPILVSPPEARDKRATPATYRQPPARKGAPRIEASLTSSTLAAGGRIAGAVALYDFDSTTTHRVRVALIERNRLFQAGVSGYVNRDGRAWAVHVESPPGAHERGTPFDFLIPRSLVPSFLSQNYEHGYVLEVEAKTGMFSSAVVTIPVTMTNDQALKDESMRLAAPSVGASRMAELGRDVAARRGYVIDGVSLRRTLDVGTDAIDLELRHEDKAGEGSFLIGRLTFPRLGLGLAIEPATGLASYFARDVEIGAAEWDREHRVSARDAKQAAGFLRPLVERLPKEASFSRFGDDVAEVREPDTAQSARSLDAFAARVERLALALGEAIAQLPSPSNVEAGTEWQALATRLGGRFVAGDLGIDGGRLGGTEVRVQTEWAPSPRHRIELVPDPPLPDEVGFVLASPRAEAASVPSVSPEVRALIARLPEEATNLSLGAGLIAITLPFGEGERPRARPTEVASTIDLLARLAPLFALRHGPFR